MSSPYTAAQRQQFRSLLLSHGQVIAGRLAKILAGEDVRLEDIQQLDFVSHGEPPKVRLRRFLDHLVRLQKDVESDHFGLCVKCGGYLTAVELLEVPWAEACSSCR